LVLNHKVPIIALTADAFTDTRKKVLESSFGDFVTKPFDQETLFLKINRQQLKILELKIHESNEPVMSDVNKDGLVDLSYFKEVVEDDDDMLVELLTMFLDQNPKEINDLKLMHELGSMDDVKKLAHKMKSSLGTLGMKATVHVLSMIEKEALEGHKDRVGELVGVVAHSCEQARAEINTIVDRISAGR
jgi:HPt (histidine-containing phosphotransfer) domain-containing protein